MDDDLHRHLIEMGRRHWWYRGRRRVIQSVATHHLPAVRDRSILEIGAGTGSVTGLLTTMGRVTAIEPSAIARAACAEVAPDATLLAGGVEDLGDLTDTSGPFDLVVAFDVIEHLSDDTAGLAAMRDQVRRGGSIVVTVPALELLWGPHDWVNGHFRRYSRVQLERLVRRSALDIRYISYFNTVVFPAVAAVRLGRRLRPGPPPPPHSDFVMPPRPVNRALTAVLEVEARWMATRSLPIGSSLIAVATRP